MKLIKNYLILFSLILGCFCSANASVWNSKLAKEIIVDTTTFSGALSSLDKNVQQALNDLDQVIPSSSSIANKMDKVSAAIPGNIPIFISGGNVVDSGMSTGTITSSGNYVSLISTNTQYMSGELVLPLVSASTGAFNYMTAIDGSFSGNVDIATSLIFNSTTSIYQVYSSTMGYGINASNYFSALDLMATHGVVASTITVSSITFLLDGTVMTSTSNFEGYLAPGTTDQYLRGDKTWQTISSLSTPLTKTFYVDEMRVDTYTATGSSETPFKTIMAAVNSIAALATTDKILLEIRPGTYAENVVLESTGLYDLTIRGNNAVYIHPPSGYSLKSTANNNNLHNLMIDGIDLNGDVLLVAAGSGFLNEGGWFQDSYLYTNFSITGAGGSTVLRMHNTELGNALNIIDVSDAFLQGGGGVYSLTTIAGTSSVVFDGIAAMGGLNLTLGSTLTLRNGSLLGANGAGVSISGLLRNYGCPVYQDTTIEPGGQIADFHGSYTSIINNGSFSNNGLNIYGDKHFKSNAYVDGFLSVVGRTYGLDAIFTSTVTASAFIAYSASENGVGNWWDTTGSTTVAISGASGGSVTAGKGTYTLMVSPIAAAEVMYATDTIHVIATCEYITSSGGAVSLTSNPRITAGVEGQDIELWGTSDTNTITIATGNGLSLNAGASMTFGRRDGIGLRYLDGLWCERWRSNNS